MHTLLQDHIYPGRIERFWSKVVVDETSGCWVWVGARIPDGYGSFRISPSIVVGAHRFSYMTWRAPIAPGLETDHLCRIRNCVNPWHLEPVTTKENQRRGFGPAGLKQRQTHCIRGHEFTAENIESNSLGHRRCRTCRGMRNRGEIGAFSRG